MLVVIVKPIYFNALFILAFRGKAMLCMLLYKMT